MTHTQDPPAGEYSSEFKQSNVETFGKKIAEHQAVLFRLADMATKGHVSRKTASHHVSNILTKLNLRNRAEAAAYAVGAVGPTGAPASGHP